MSGRDARHRRATVRRGLGFFAGVGAVTALAAACGSDPGPAIVPRWKFDTTAPAAPPGIGPERRVVVAHQSGQGELVTLNEENGTRVEGPFAPTFPTEHAPVVTGTTIVLVSSVGRLVGYDFAGQTRFSGPSPPFGLSGPIAVAADGSLRIATTSGRLLGFAADGASLFDTSIDGAATSRLAVSANGTAYAATDIGRVVGVDATGAIVFDVDVPAPASGPSLGPDGRVSVGALDGVKVFDASGTELWSHARAARVVGTRYLDDGRLVAWGEDGIVEILGASGDVQGTFETTRPIYAEVVPVEGRRLAVFDEGGTVHRVDLAGKVDGTYALGETPREELAVGALGLVYVAYGSTIRALDFAFE